MLYQDKSKNKDVTNSKRAPEARLTILVYLNDNFSGGQTTFFSAKGTQTLQVTPKTGTFLSVLQQDGCCEHYNHFSSTCVGQVLIYNQRLLHEGSVVESGRKYVMRSDIMFSSEDQIQSTTSSSSYFSNCVVQ
jgi:hypothetical protein